MRASKYELSPGLSSGHKLLMVRGIGLLIAFFRLRFLITLVYLWFCQESHSNKIAQTRTRDTSSCPIGSTAHWIKRKRGLQQSESETLNILRHSQSEKEPELYSITQRKGLSFRANMISDIKFYSRFRRRYKTGTHTQYLSFWSIK